MTDEIRPDRLDELFDGHAAAETDAERDLLHLAAELRASAPAAPDHLRERIAGLREPEVGRRATGGWWSRIRWRMLAPTMAAVIAVLVAVTVIPQVTDSPDGDVSLSDLPADSAPNTAGDSLDRSKDAPGRSGVLLGPAGSETLEGGGSPEPSATTVAPVAVDGVVRDVSLDQAQDAVAAAITLAGGSVTSQTGDDATRTVTASLARADVEELVRQLTAIDGITFAQDDLESAARSRSTIRLDLRTP